MTPVDQTTFAPTLDDPDQTGNCLQAAIASLLDLELEVVPNFAAIPGDDGEWFMAMWDWFHDRGYRLEVYDEPPGRVCIAVGQSPRGNWNHVVVADGATTLHDPHPSRDGLDGFLQWWVPVPHGQKLWGDW